MGKKYSLSIGLNKVDPASYDGEWDGALACCEKDAKDIINITSDLNYDRKELLLTKNATRENVIKALLFAVSLYPIGAYVFLHNGKIGQVVDVNPLNPKLPVVQILGEKDEHGDPISISVGNDVRIVRTLSRQEVLDLQKVVENKKAK